MYTQLTLQTGYKLWYTIGINYQQDRIMMQISDMHDHSLDRVHHDHDHDDLKFYEFCTIFCPCG